MSEGPDPHARRDTAPLWLLLAAGAWPVLAALARGERWGAQPTVGLLMMALALRLLLEGVRAG